MKKLILLCLLALPAYSATGISAAASAWNTAATWKVAEAGSGAIMVTRSASTSSTSTSIVWSSAWTCTNADVLEGVVLHLKANGATGTMTISVSDDNGVSETKSSDAVNLSAIPTDPSEYYFALTSTLTCDGGSDYKVGIKFSAGASGATVYRDGTANNWFRIPQTSTAYGAAPAAADNLHVVGFAVTMDSTDSTDHGTVDIGSGGSVTFGVTAATAYVLKVSGDINIWSGGTLNVGTVGTAMPSDSTGTILLDCGSNVQYGLYVRSGGTFVMQGATKTTWTYLASDELANSTELTTADSTGWASGDLIAIASTTRTAAQSEQGDLNGAASGTTLTVHGFAGAGGGLANAHSGTAPTRAEIINLTRNVVLRGASASLQSYIYVETAGSVDWDYAEFSWLGSNGTAGKQGIYAFTGTAGSFSAVNSSFHDYAIGAGAFGIVFDGVTPTFTVTGNVFYNINGIAIYVATPCQNTWTISDNVIVKTSAQAISLEDAQGTFTGNRVSGSSSTGIYFNFAGQVGTNSGNVAHSNAGNGVYLFANLGGGYINTLSMYSVWRNNTSGLLLLTQSGRVILDSWTLFGNNGINIESANASLFDLVIKSLTSSGDSTFATTSGLSITTSTTAYYKRITLDNCDFSTVTGIMVAHTNDVLTQSDGHVDVLSRNTKVNGVTVQYDVVTDGNLSSRIAVQRYNQTAGDHRTYLVNGLIQTDSIIFKTAAPSERVTPSSATVKIESARFPKTVANGATATFSVWVRKSEAADAGGADYNGNQQRLVLKANPALGIDADVVLDTAVAAVGDWEELTGTSAAVSDDGTLEAVVDSDGTAGWINVSDWQTPGATTYWLDGLPAYGLGSGAAAATTRAYPVGQ